MNQKMTLASVAISVVILVSVVYFGYPVAQKIMSSLPQIDNTSDEDTIISGAWNKFNNYLLVIFFIIVIFISIAFLIVWSKL